MGKLKLRQVLYLFAVTLEWRTLSRIQSADLCTCCPETSFFYPSPHSNPFLILLALPFLSHDVGRPSYQGLSEMVLAWAERMPIGGLPIVSAPLCTPIPASCFRATPMSSWEMARPGMTVPFDTRRTQGPEKLHLAQGPSSWWQNHA